MSIPDGSLRLEVATTCHPFRLSSPPRPVASTHEPVFDWTVLGDRGRKRPRSRIDTDELRGHQPCDRRSRYNLVRMRDRPDAAADRLPDLSWRFAENSS